MLVLWFVVTALAILSIHHWVTSCFALRPRQSLWAALVAALFMGAHCPLALVLHANPTPVALVAHALVVAAMLISLCAFGPFLALQQARRLASQPSRTAESESRRRFVEGALGSTLWLAGGGVLAWGTARGRYEYELCDVEVRIPGLPRALDGYTLLQISDIHAGLFVDDEQMAFGFQLGQRTTPDLIVVTGDLVDFDSKYAPIVANRLRRLRSRDGVEVVLGNHDYETGRRAMCQALQRVGIEPLINRGKVIRASDGGGLALLGLDDVSAPQYGGEGPRLDLALRHVPRDVPRIILSHQPQTIEQCANAAALQLSGHTHGGQINPLGLMNQVVPYLVGRYRVGDTDLYVSRGFGTVGPPSRVGAPPELTRVILLSS